MIKYMEVKSDQIEQDLHADKSLALTQKSNNKTLYLDSIRAFQEGDTFNGNRYLDAAKAEDPNSFLTILTLSNLAHSGKKSLAAFEFYSHVFGLITKINSAKHCDIFLSSLKFFIQATDSIHPSFIPHARNYGELYLNRLTEDEFTELLKKISELLTTSDYERISGRTVFYIFELLNYHRQGRRDFLHLTFSSFVVPLIERLLQYKNYFTALETEKYVYNNHVKTIETSECFRFVYGKLAPLMHAAGEALPEVKSRRKKFRPPTKNSLCSSQRLSVGTRATAPRNPATLENNITATLHS